MFWLPPGDYVVLADPPSIHCPRVTRRRSAGQRRCPAASRSHVDTAIYANLLSAVADNAGCGNHCSEEWRPAERYGHHRSEGRHFQDYRRTPRSPIYRHHPSSGSRARSRGANADPNAPQRIQGFLGLEYRDPSIIDMRSTNLGGTVPAVGTFFLASGGDGFRATFEVRDVLPASITLCRA
jgi:hypothetical protein